MRNTTGTAMQLAGMAREGGAAFLTGGAFWAPQFPVALATSDGESCLTWEAEDPTPQRARKDEGVLDDFLRLASATPDSVLRFVRRYGPLPFCPHGWPRPHLPPSKPVRSCQPTVQPPQRVAWYAATAAQMGAILRLSSAELRQTVTKGLLDETLPALNAFLFPDQRFHATAQRPRDGWLRRKVAEYVNSWLLADEVTMRITWDAGEEPTLEWASWQPRVREALGRQLAAVLVRTSIVFCSGCGTSFTPGRRPRNAAYCQGCREAGVPARKRQQRRRDRLRGSAGR